MPLALLPHQTRDQESACQRLRALSSTQPYSHNGMCSTRPLLIKLQGLCLADLFACEFH